MNCSERENLNENYIEKNPNFWNYSSGCGQTRSLPRPKRKVKFKDDPPERPPPPAPERHTTSFKAVNALQQDSTRFAILQQNMQMQHKNVASPEFCNLPENYEQFVEGIHHATPYNENDHDSRFAQTSPKLGRKKLLKVSCLDNRNQRSSSLTNEAIKDDDEYKVDMGDKVDHWFETYGKAVLNDTLRDGEEIPVNVVKGELPIDSMRGKVSHVRQCIADQEKKSKEKPTILPNRKHRSSSLDERDGSSFLLRSNVNQNKDAGTFKNGKAGKQFSYVKQYLLEQEEEEKRVKEQSAEPKFTKFISSSASNHNDSSSANTLYVKEPNTFINASIGRRPVDKPNDSPINPGQVNSVDTIKQIVKHLLKNKGRMDEPTEEEINQAMEEFERMNKVFVGGAADGILYPGDKVASINHQDTSRMTHHDAQNLLRKAGTSAQLNIVRPGIVDNQQGLKLNRSSSLGSSGSGSYYHPNDGTGQIEILDRDIEYAKVHAQHQPYRTNSLALPSPKIRNVPIQRSTSIKPSGGKTFQKPTTTVPNVKPLPVSTSLQNNRPNQCRPKSMYSTFDCNGNTTQNVSQTNAAKTVLDAISNKQGKQQPYRTTPLVSPTPRTIGDVTSNIAGGRNTPQFNRPTSRPFSPYSPLPQESNTPYRFSPNNPNAITRNVTIGGTPKKIVSTQFNSPIGMYSDETLAEVAAENQTVLQGMRDGCDTPSQHPGYVQGTKPHLPTPKDNIGTRAQPSETFKIILESEMDQASNAKGVHSTPFTKQHQEAHRSSSSMSNRSNFDPSMLDSNINQSASFKRLMYSVMSDEFENQ